MASALGSRHSVTNCIERVEAINGPRGIAGVRCVVGSEDAEHVFEAVGAGDGGAEELVAQAVFGVEALRDEGDGVRVREDGGSPGD